MKPTLQVVVVLAGLAACKGKADKAASPEPTGVTGSAGSAGSAAADSPPPAAGDVKIGAEPKFGCLGWSAATKTAACVTGRTFSNEPAEYALSVLGTTDAPVKLAAREDDKGSAALDSAAVDAANAKLATLRLQPLPTPAKTIDKAGTTELGGGASLVWTSKQTSPGGENEPPTHQHKAVVTCGANTVELVASEGEGVDPTFAVWSLGDHALIETVMTTAREGEYGEERSAALIELATCKLTSSTK